MSSQNSRGEAPTVVVPSPAAPLTGRLSRHTTHLRDLALAFDDAEQLFIRIEAALNVGSVDDAPAAALELERGLRIGRRLVGLVSSSIACLGGHGAVPTLGPHDVVMGSGNKKYPGSDMYYNLVRTKVSSFPRNKPEAAVAREIMDELLSLDPPARFVHENPNGGGWIQNFDADRLTAKIIKRIRYQKGRDRANGGKWGGPDPPAAAATSATGALSPDADSAMEKGCNEEASTSEKNQASDVSKDTLERNKVECESLSGVAIRGLATTAAAATSATRAQSPDADAAMEMGCDEEASTSEKNEASDVSEDTLERNKVEYKSLSGVAVGSRISIYWKGDDRYYPGKVAEIHVQGEHQRVTIHYDDGEVEKVDLSVETFCVGEYEGSCAPNTRGRGPFAKAPCTKKRKGVDTTALPQSLACLYDPPTKRRRPRRRTISAQQQQLALGPEPSERHYITDKLGMSREEIIGTLRPELVNSFGDCGWSNWDRMYRPIFILSPFDISGEGGMAEEWTNAYITRRKGNNLMTMPHLVYWYEEGWSASKGSKSFSLLGAAKIFPFDTGISRGWASPPFLQTMHTRSEYEDRIHRGIQQMMKDQKLPKNQRGGPMFFPELREKEKDAAHTVVRGLEKRYASWKSNDKYKRCVLRAIYTRANGKAGKGRLTSLELCAGKGAMSESLQNHCLSTVTLDNDPKRAATSQLSLAQLEDAIVNNQVGVHPELDRDFAVIWAGPECRTWSRAQNGRYRNKDFIECRGNTVLDVEAQQARKDIESLVNILSYYKTRNPAVLITIENPVGYLHHHPVSVFSTICCLQNWWAGAVFHDVLGLQLVKISYCHFSRGTVLHPQKDTHLWTNSESLIHEFGQGDFACSLNKDCIGRRPDGKHVSRAQDLPGKCAAYPAEVCSFIAPLLYAEALKATLGVERSKRKEATAATKR